MSTNSPTSRPEEQAYAEDSALTILFGNSGKVKILAVFLSEDQYDLNVTDIAKLADVSRNTVYRHLDDLCRIGVVEQTRKIGGSKMYHLGDNEIVSYLERIEWELMDEFEDTS